MFAVARILQCFWNLSLQAPTRIGFSCAIWRPCSLDGHSGNTGVCACGERARAEGSDDALERIRRDGSAGREANVGDLRGAACAGHRDDLKCAFHEATALLDAPCAALELVGDAIDDAMRVVVAHVVRAHEAHRAVRTSRDVRITIGARRRRGGIGDDAADVMRVDGNIAPASRAARERDAERGAR
jgi:hypothetical protein